MYILIKSGYQ